MDSSTEGQADVSPDLTEDYTTVTLSLPRRTIEALQSCDRDLAQAVVRVTYQAFGRAAPEGSTFEIVKVAPHASVLIVGTRTKLGQIPWVRLVEIAPGRNLIAIPTGTPLESLEAAALDLIERTPADDAFERALLCSFHAFVGRLRRHEKVTLAEILIVDSDD
jgi:hypothetical protein